MSYKVIAGNFLNFLFNDIVTHIPCHFIRLGFLRLINSKISSSTKVLMHVRLLHFWKLKTEKNVVINQYCLIDCRRFVVNIGANSDIGPYTRLWTLGHNPHSENHEVSGGDIVIGHHVWIASGVTVLPNVKIGDGAVIASGSIVHKSVKPKTIVAGNPAKEISKRINSLSYELKYSPWFE